MNNLQKYTIRRFFKNLISQILFFLYRIQTNHKVDANKHDLFIGECSYAPWKFDSDFIEIQKKIAKFTLVDLNKQYLIYSYIKQLAKLKIEGDYLEVGVWRGGVSALVGLTFKKFSPSSRRLFLADTYEGMPNTSSKDNFYKGGELNDTSEKIVEDLFINCKLFNYQILKGYFPQDTSHLIDSNTFACVHIDVDIYESARDTFNWVWPKINRCGMVIFDDYGYSATEGVTSFVNEYVSNLPDALLIFNMGGQAVVIKLHK